MSTARSFLFSREFKQLCIYAGLLLAGVIALVAVRVVSTLRRNSSDKPKPDDDHASSKGDHSRRVWRKRHGK